MSLTPDAPRGGLSRPPDFKLREQGLALIMRLAGLIRVGKAYQVGNAVFNAQIESLIAALETVHKEAEEVVLVAIDTDLYLNGFRVPIRAANVRFHQAVLDEFRRRHIAGLRVERGVERHEIEHFFEHFMQPEIYTGTSLLEACLAAGIDRIQPAVHASTHAMEAGFTEDPQHGYNDDEAVVQHGPDAGSFPEAPDGSDSDGIPTRPGRAPKGSARKSYWVAMAGMRSLLAPTSLQDNLEMRHAKRVVQPLVDGAFENEPVLVGLSTLGHHDEFTYAHAVNVTMVAVSMGHYLGLDRRGLSDLGVAALLHDVGKNAVAHLVQNPIDEFTDEEKAAVERHPVEGVKTLAKSTTLNGTTLRCMRASLEHHMGPGGRGYPHPEGWQPSALSRIISVADCYVCLQTYRSRHGANVTPYQALGMVLGPMRSSFEPVVLWALVQAVGLYPPGQLVELDDARIALVLAPNSEDLERPSVKVVARSDRRRMSREERVEYRPLPPGVSIRRALKAEEYPEDPTVSEDEEDTEKGAA